MLTRRSMLTGSALMALPAWSADNPFAALEAKSGGRLGVAVLNTDTDGGSPRTLGWRAGERFPMCSTFKFLLAAAVLARISARTENPDRIVPYRRADLVTYSPVTGQHVGEGGMSVNRLWQAVMEESDNTAANLLLNTIGGPKGWTDFARSLDDTVSRLDRREPDLNSAIAGDERDTTTPQAMLGNMRKVLTQDPKPLTFAYRLQLLGAMERSTTGLKRLRAGVPSAWTAGDKSGSGANGTYNDIALIMPPGRTIFAAVYLTGSKLSADDSNALIAEIGRIIAES